VVYQTALLRVVLVDDANFPGFCRVIWNQHVAEMTDLAAAERDHLMCTVWQVEAAIRAVMAPHKINLAALGNMVPHLHWHVIPRYRDDTHFPAPIWAPSVRVHHATMLADRRALLPALRRQLLQSLSPDQTRQ
jgi:diadenosine tetraphosphate (Ap4A) HIT family hydrolase